MPLSINVGLSRKASKDYQSTGASINVTAELDQSLLAKPAELQAQIDALYAQANTALDRQAGQATAPRTAARTNGNGIGYARGGPANGRTNGNGHAQGSGMTSSQRRAIESMARRAGLDAEQEAQDRFGVTLENLTIKNASNFIDDLKALTAAGDDRGSRS